MVLTPRLLRSLYTDANKVETVIYNIELEYSEMRLPQLPLKGKDYTVIVAAIGDIINILKSCKNSNATYA